ncbi:hypothetical protein [Corynebacterium vitaeruminis]|nr:hypothetical protein [Corynebacterium vitaeruminis]
MRIPDRLKNMGVATIGQGFNFLAMLLPVFGKEASQLAYLMFPLSLSLVLFKLGSLSFHVRYLILRVNQRHIGTAVSLSGLIFLSALTSILGAVIANWSSYWGMLLVWGGLLTFSHGLYYMSVAVVITEQREAFYGKVRFAYGLINFVLTAAVVWLVPFQAGLVVVTFLNTILTGMWMMSRCENSLVGSLRGAIPQVFGKEGSRYARESWRTTSAVLVSDIGLQIQGFLTPLMGAYQELWAIVVRLSGGFGTLGQQIIAPVFEIRIAEAIRGKAFSRAGAWAFKAQLTGISLAIAVIPIQIASIVFATSQSVPQQTLAITMISIYTLGLVSSSVSMKSPYILGHERGMLWWSFLRVGLLLPMLLLHEMTLLLFISVTQLLLGALLLPLSVRSSRDLMMKNVTNG